MKKFRSVNDRLMDLIPFGNQKMLADEQNDEKLAMKFLVIVMK